MKQGAAESGGVAVHQPTDGGGNSREAIAGGEGGSSGAECDHAPRSTDRIDQCERIAPVNKKPSIIHHASAPEGAGGPPITDLQSAARDNRCSRVSVIP